MKKVKKPLKITLIILGGLFILLAGAFFIYVSDYYRADDRAIAAMSGDSSIRVEGNLTILAPQTPSDTALIFYPGGKVEAEAYIPLLEALKENGITCVLVNMPFHLAVFDVNAADKVFDKLPNIKNWYIGGHSLGGAMASDYMSKHKDKFSGLILLGAYIYGEIPPTDALTLYGSNDLVLDRSKITYTDNVIQIDGGNHGQFGNYGLQSGDGTATISSQEQQKIAIDEICGFIQKQNKQ